MTPFSSERPRILVVDDAPESLNVLLYALRDDYIVNCARTGPEALRLAAAKPQPDLIILDIVMPEMDGYQVCARLKENAATNAIPVIFLTSLEEEESETKGFSLGAVDYIRKPIRIASLHLRVRLHLDLLKAHRRLQELNSVLIEAARLREDIESISRHDLKGPLTSIIGVPEYLLMTGDFTDVQRHLIKSIEAAGYSMLEMINRSLDLFKMENGRYDFHPEPVDILSVMRQALAELTPVLIKKNLTVCLRIDGVVAQEGLVVMVLAERFLCHSIFSNLCRNAVEASPAEGVISILFERGRAVTVGVQNDGEIPGSIRERFFGKFVTAGKKNGSGLGAYSAKLMTQIQRGAISLDCSVAGRTSIRVTLPSGEESGRGLC